MFYICLSNFRSYCFIFTVIFLSSIFGNNEHNPDIFDRSSISCEYEWITRYFDAVNEDTSMDEMVDFLFNLRLVFLSKGYEVPEFTSLITNVLDYLLSQGMEIDEKIIEEFYRIFKQKEVQNVNCIFKLLDSHEKVKTYKIKKKKPKIKKEKPEVEMSGKTALGLIKVFAGALCCIIPHPATIAIGGGLVLSGVKDISDELIEMDKENRKKQEIEGLPKPPHHFSPDFFEI